MRDPRGAAGEPDSEPRRGGLEEGREVLGDEVGRGVGDVGDGLRELGLEGGVVVPRRHVEACRAEGVFKDAADELLDPLARVGGLQAPLDRLRVAGRDPRAKTRGMDDQRRHRTTPPPPSPRAARRRRLGSPAPISRSVGDVRR